MSVTAELKSLSVTALLLRKKMPQTKRGKICLAPHAGELSKVRLSFLMLNGKNAVKIQQFINL